MFQTKYDAEAKEWRGCDLPPLYNPKISLARLILNSLTTFGPKIAQVHGKIPNKKVIKRI